MSGPFHLRNTLMTPSENFILMCDKRIARPSESAYDAPACFITYSLFYIGNTKIVQSQKEPR